MDRLTTDDGRLVGLESYLSNNSQIPMGVFIHEACKAFKVLSEYEKSGYTPAEVNLAMSLAVSIK